MFTKSSEFANFFRNLATPGLWIDTINFNDDPSGIVYRENRTSDEKHISFHIILRGISDIMVAPEHRSSVNVDWKLTFNHDPADTNVKNIWRLAQITIPATEQIPFYLLCNNSAFDPDLKDRDGILIYLDKEHPANWMDCDEFLIMEDSTEDVETLLKHKVHAVNKDSLRVSLNI